ncbi:MAG: Hsp20/alpha crystallin family protein, partial [Bacteroidales bacterium]
MINNRFFNEPKEQTNYPSIFNNHFNLNSTPEVHIPINIIQNKENVILELAVPGRKKDHIQMELEKNLLVVKSLDKETNSKEEEKKYLRKDFQQEPFEKHFTISEKIDKEKIEASFNEGILKIVLDPWG